MKKGILLLLLFSSGLAKAQSLKEALFSGKLKNQPGTVIRKGDDLASKMDTTQKAPATDTVIANFTAPMSQTGANGNSVVVDTAYNSPGGNGSNPASVVIDTATVVGDNAGNASIAKEAKPKDNNGILKGYMDSLVTTLKTEVMPSKKIKKGTYNVLVSYNIGLDGEVTIRDVSVAPDNGFLQQQVKERLSLGTPHLMPVLNSSGAPRRASKSYSFNLSKD